MKEHARGLVIGSILLLLALPVLYVGGEGVWYLASGESHFPSDSAYRRVYAPLDWAGNHWPQVYEAREGLANFWLRLSSDSSRRAQIDPNVLPSPYFSSDDVQYTPPARKSD